MQLTTALQLTTRSIPYKKTYNVTYGWQNIKNHELPVMKVIMCSHIDYQNESNQTFGRTSNNILGFGKPIFPTLPGTSYSCKARNSVQLLEKPKVITLI